MSKIDTQGMSLPSEPEIDPKTGLWKKPKPIAQPHKPIIYLYCSVLTPNL